ncbi:hypothetical protein [Dawidia soli]|uniref:Uncharacterized protein n=1 Tax=Dawidia soli TaxID=2782352 RepID=A0AAP2DF15_9BACT|nr:hypothetical protein [Dawidia soli]MBT1690062.1 hypothetical protein [Dawidia soli]
MKLYNLIIVLAAFAIAVTGAIAGQRNSALTIIYGKDISTNQCLQGDPSTMQPGCSTAAASFNARSLFMRRAYRGVPITARSGQRTCNPCGITNTRHFAVPDWASFNLTLQKLPDI